MPSPTKSSSVSNRTTARRTTAAKSSTVGKRSANNNSTLDKVVSSVKKTYKDLTTSDRNNDTQLEKFFLDSIKDIYWAEKNLLKALQKMKKAATTTQLQTAFEDHWQQTQTHIARLEQVFELLGATPRAKKCEAMQGLIDEGETIIGETEDGTATRDVGLIMAAQKVEHYEIATYGGLCQLAKTLGNDKVAKILGQTLAEEKTTDEKLTQIAENNINYTAKRERAA